MVNDGWDKKVNLLDETRRIIDQQVTEVKNQRKQVGWTLPVIFTAASIGGAAVFYIFRAVPPVPMVEQPVVWGEQVAAVIMLVGLLMVVPLSPIMLLSSSHPALGVLSERRLEVHLTEGRLALFIARWRGETEPENQELAFGPDPGSIETMLTEEDGATLDHLLQQNLEAIRHNEQVLKDNRERLHEFYQKVDDALTFFVIGMLFIFTGHFLIFVINSI